MKKEIQRIDVIVGGLLKIEAVGRHLLLGRRQYDFPAALPPPFGSWKFREQYSQKKERNGLAHQMGVGRKICREVGLDMPSAGGQCPYPFAAHLGCHCRRTFEQ